MRISNFPHVLACPEQQWYDEDQVLYLEKCKPYLAAVDSNPRSVKWQELAIQLLKLCFVRTLMCSELGKKYWFSTLLITAQLQWLIRKISILSTTIWSQCSLARPSSTHKRRMKLISWTTFWNLEANQECSNFLYCCIGARDLVSKVYYVSIGTLCYVGWLSYTLSTVIVQ